MMKTAVLLCLVAALAAVSANFLKDSNKEIDYSTTDTTGVDEKFDASSQATGTWPAAAGNNWFYAEPYSSVQLAVVCSAGGSLTIIAQYSGTETETGALSHTLATTVSAVSLSFERTLPIFAKYFRWKITVSTSAVTGCYVHTILTVQQRAPLLMGIDSTGNKYVPIKLSADGTVQTAGTSTSTVNIDKSSHDIHIFGGKTKPTNSDEASSGDMRHIYTDNNGRLRSINYGYTQSINVTNEQDEGIDVYLRLQKMTDSGAAHVAIQDSNGDFVDPSTGALVATAYGSMQTALQQEANDGVGGGNELKTSLFAKEHNNFANIPSAMSTPHQHLHSRNNILLTKPVDDDGLRAEGFRVVDAVSFENKDHTADKINLTATDGGVANLSTSTTPHFVSLWNYQPTGNSSAIMKSKQPILARTGDTVIVEFTAVFPFTCEANSRQVIGVAYDAGPMKDGSLGTVWSDGIGSTGVGVSDGFFLGCAGRQIGAEATDTTFSAFIVNAGKEIAVSPPPKMVTNLPETPIVNHVNTYRIEYNLGARTSVRMSYRRISKEFVPIYEAVTDTTYAAGRSQMRYVYAESVAETNTISADTELKIYSYNVYVRSNHPVSSGPTMSYGITQASYNPADTTGDGDATILGCIQSAYDFGQFPHRAPTPLVSVELAVVGAEVDVHFINAAVHKTSGSFIDTTDLVEDYVSEEVSPIMWYKPTGGTQYVQVVNPALEDSNVIAGAMITVGSTKTIDLSHEVLWAGDAICVKVTAPTAKDDIHYGLQFTWRHPFD